MQSTMSWPLLRLAPSEPCQVSPPSRNSTLSFPRSARTRLTTAGKPVEPADASIGLGQRLEILVGQRIGRGRLLGNAEALEKVLAGEMRRLAPRLADAEIDRRLAEIDRHQLAVDIGDVQQRDVAERVELEQFRFGEALLRQGARERAVAGRERRGRGADLENFTTRNHRPLQPTVTHRYVPELAAGGDSEWPGRPGHDPYQCRMPGTLSFRPSFCDAR